MPLLLSAGEAIVGHSWREPLSPQHHQPRPLPQVWVSWWIRWSGWGVSSDWRNCSFVKFFLTYTANHHLSLCSNCLVTSTPQQPQLARGWWSVWPTAGGGRGRGASPCVPRGQGVRRDPAGDCWRGGGARGRVLQGQRHFPQACNLWPRSVREELTTLQQHNPDSF